MRLRFVNLMVRKKPRTTCLPVIICSLLTISSAGLAYTAIGALTFLRRTPNTTLNTALLSPGSVEFESLVGWLVARQTSDLGGEEEEEEETSDGKLHTTGEVIPNLQATLEGLSLKDRLGSLPPVPPQSHGSIECAGFSGRCNKFADTCYSFWIMATLSVRFLSD